MDYLLSNFDQSRHGADDRNDRHSLSGACRRNRTGCSAIAGIYYMVIFMMAFGFSIGAQIMMARRNGERQYNEIGPIFYQGIYFLLVLAVIVFAMSLHFSPHLLRISSLHPTFMKQPSATSLAHLRFLLLIYHGDVPGILRGHHSNQNADIEFHCHGTVECGIQLHPDFRKIRLPQTGNCRSSHRFVIGRIGLCTILHHLYLEAD